MRLTFGELRQLIREAVKRKKPHVTNARREDFEQGRVLPGQKFYHASPKRFHHGDILMGGNKGGYGCAHDNVCMTTSPDPHGTIRHNIPDWDKYYASEPDPTDTMTRYQSVNKDWYVYEVEPLYDVSYVEGNQEYQTRAAKVIKNLGKASAFLKKRQPVMGVAGALSADRDRDRGAKHADRQRRKLKKLGGDE